MPVAAAEAAEEMKDGDIRSFFAPAAQLQTGGAAVSASAAGQHAKKREGPSTTEKPAKKPRSNGGAAASAAASSAPAAASSAPAFAAASTKTAPKAASFFAASTAAPSTQAAASAASASVELTAASSPAAAASSPQEESEAESEVESEVESEEEHDEEHEAESEEAAVSYKRGPPRKVGDDLSASKWEARGAIRAPNAAAVSQLDAAGAPPEMWFEGTERTRRALESSGALPQGGNELCGQLVAELETALEDKKKLAGLFRESSTYTARKRTSAGGVMSCQFRNCLGNTELRSRGTSGELCVRYARHQHRDLQPLKEEEEQEDDNDDEPIAEQDDDNDDEPIAEQEDDNDDEVCSTCP